MDFDADKIELDQIHYIEPGDSFTLLPEKNDEEIRQWCQALYKHAEKINCELKVYSIQTSSYHGGDPMFLYHPMIYFRFVPPGSTVLY